MILDLKYPSLNVAQRAGLKQALPTYQEAEHQVSLSNLTTLNREPSSGPDPEGPQFKKGDEVTVVRRMSWAVPQTENRKYRKDLVEGTQDLVKGLDR